MSQGSHPSTSTTTPTATPPPPTHRRIKYEPIKSRNITILSALNRHPTASPTHPRDLSKSPLPKKKEASSSSPSGSLSSHRKFPPPSATTTSAAYTLIKNREAQFTPPNNFVKPRPPPPIFKKRVETCTSSSQAQTGASTSTSTLKSSPSKASRTIVSSKKRKYFYPKVDFLHTPLKKRRKVVNYVPDKKTVSESDLKLVTDFLANTGQSQRRAEDRLQLENVLKKYTTNTGDANSQGSSPSTVDPTTGINQQKSDTTTTNVKPVRRKVDAMKKREQIAKIPENPLVSHTIELLRHKRDLQKRLELIDEEGVVHKLEHLPPLKEEGHKSKLAIPNLPLTGQQAKELIQNRLPILLAHGGYTHTEQQPMEVLGDVLEDFYKKMAHRMKQITEMEMSGCEQEFPDPLERTLVEMNLGGVRGIQRFYKSRIVDQRKRMEDHCKYLRKLYAHKIRLKVGIVSSSSGGNLGGNFSSSSIATSTSSQVVSPGNSVLTEILSGLDATGSSYPYELINYQQQMQMQK